MQKTRVLFVSDTHWCHIDWYGVTGEERMERLSAHIKEEYEKEPFGALIFLGDYSLDHWKWNVKGSYLAQGISYTKKFVDKCMPEFKKLGVPICMTAGNHEQYGEALWNEFTGCTRTDHVVVGDCLFIVLDTFGADLDPTEHSDGTYTPADMAFINELMAKYPDKKVVLCAHHFEPSRESEEFKTLVRENDRILCLTGGHTHLSNVVELGEEWGNKALLYTGNYSYCSGKVGAPMNSMWGFRDIIITDGELTSRYITPANTIVWEEQTVNHPYGYQDEYKRSF